MPEAACQTPPEMYFSNLRLATCLASFVPGLKDTSINLGYKSYWKQCWKVIQGEGRLICSSLLHSYPETSSAFSLEIHSIRRTECCDSLVSSHIDAQGIRTQKPSRCLWHCRHDQTCTSSTEDGRSPRFPGLTIRLIPTSVPRKMHAHAPLCPPCKPWCCHKTSWGARVGKEPSCHAQGVRWWYMGTCPEAKYRLKERWTEAAWPPLGL